MAVMAGMPGCVWGIPVPVVPVLIRRPVLVAMVGRRAGSVTVVPVVPG
jgi:hypothetical protein